MDILIVGGTQFLGRTIVETAVAAGHNVTLFNRGKTNPELFAHLEQLRGDRNAGDYASLQGRTFDAVIDVSAYYPRAVRELLAAVQTDYYALVSTISVFADMTKPNQDESAETANTDAIDGEDVTAATYGPLKVLCEEAALAAMPNNTLIARSGLIVGPYDHTDRFSYFPIKAATQTELLMPPLDTPIQTIDVRDEAAFLVMMAEQKVSGTFNLTGRTATYADVLAASLAATENNPIVTEVDHAFLADNGINPWSDLPLYMPPAMQGTHMVAIEKALSHGLTLRSLTETVAGLMAWHATRSAEHELKAGISAEREQQLLKLWKEQA